MTNTLATLLRPTRLLAAAALVGTGLLAGCSSDEDQTLKIGTVAGPETEVMQVALGIAKEKYDLDAEIVEFTDYVSPNAALADGSLDANAFQHEPYMQSMVEDRGYDFAIAGRTFVYPIGAYSEKFERIEDLPEGAVIALPNDPSNEGRSLILMHNQGLIELEDPQNLEATPIDIIDNPNDFEFREIEAAQLPRVLPDVDLAFINNTFAQPAGLSLDDALIKEGPESPYVNLIVVRGGDEDREAIQQLVDAYQSDAVIAKAEELFKGAAVPGWK
ncbi:MULTISPECIES: MetQ/NlpA family ABC transporter substrate-binding protein [Halomonadaceae]|uniref:MetQ/NlpA family ABC transporter substrate-binding protein n=1 Tax=Halomonadaceae TaxID=28256 RepID=UPI001581B9CA|nr:MULTISPECIES: MetQ/NlpA family ABC transporter substrate-binding protein [Halomonas]MDI4636133.1 MetQ/NlpA family ABC transporter substrate-binding protein [Halomonas sp. BMC7]NUJ60499.1 MetQ/NlpA family ABC transporter substrate-binding protein [Halomonas taeanensis]|tara:strand:- start:33994 stop:34815 length:822 start_codon:yes stop_codon:yes gene_type:complete